jgi:hypothetical protein
LLLLSSLSTFSAIGPLQFLANDFSAPNSSLLSSSGLNTRYWFSRARAYIPPGLKSLLSCSLLHHCLADLPHLRAAFTRFTRRWRPRKYAPGNFIVLKIISSNEFLHQEIQHTSRPLSQHRLSMSANAGSSLPLRTTHSRHHSHSVSTGSLHPTHRITRRKSISTSATNVAAVAAAAREAGDPALATAIPGSSRRNTMSRGAGSKAVGMATPPSSLPTHRMSLIAGRKVDRDESAIDDDQNDEMDDEENSAFNKSRTRRASEGQQLVKGDGKKAHGSELRCDKCGKGYKHSSCLTKHLFVYPSPLHTIFWCTTIRHLS